MEVVGAAYRVDPAIIRADSRGRGPKPPAHAIEAKKVAIFITVALCDCSYALLAKTIGYHKDTVCSHCDEVRRMCDDDAIEAEVDRLIGLAAKRAGVPRPASMARPDENTASLRSLLLVVIERLDRLETTISAHPSSTDERAVHPSFLRDREKKVVPLKSRRSA